MMAVAHTDQEIRKYVWDEISHDIRIDESDLRVTVIDGVVYLDGTVPSYAQKMTATQNARRVKGVFNVANNLKVRLLRAWTDEEIRHAIRTSLGHDVRISGPHKIQVIVDGGMVILSGSSPSYKQKAAVEDDAWAAPGVVEVINEITVEPSAVRADAEIAEEVRRELDADPDINATRIRVSVIARVVYLQGSVPTYYQIGDASDDAWGVPGVANVVSDLTANI